jgi:SAM-dependent methyltransferase
MTQCLCDAGIAAARPWFEDGLVRLSKCKRCGLVYADPMPDQRTIRNWYDQGYFERGAAAHVVGAQKKQAEHQFGELRELGSFSSQVRYSVLDVGCGRGTFLQVALEGGWLAFGVEPSAVAAQYATSRLGVPIENCTLEDSSYSDETFDVIRLSHVLEHMPQPIATLGRVRRLLKSDGILLLEVPREGKAYEWLFQNAYRWLLGIPPPRPCFLPEHLYLFTIGTLRRLLELTGFSVVRIRAEGMQAVGRFSTSRTGPLVQAIGLAVRATNLDVVLGGGNIVLFATRR